ncbi:glycosyltransferase family 2 protein [Actinoplanes couchii]|uniref:Glycosyl transferase family 2 n=1 Tax=Actinoplanes couchii TaxID=403638 RepID=A0ABQ3X6W5_9ACTN|nr:glycosyltransferase family 2 protein [Actinoplanes couchii]MDR6322083.1 GT2 family glycosyltransferase [Actinoplanes couchii]GID54247.1 glycosyl transferase family 2 [Actinoplanes couchii]
METIAVVVVTYNSQRLLADLIASLGPGLEGVDWHLTVADNDSHDDSVTEVLRWKPDATVIEMGRNAGYAAGINAAVSKAGPFTAVLVLNPDVRLTPGCIHPLLAALRTDGTGIAVPLLKDGDGKLIETMRREPAVRRVLADAFLGAGRAGRIGTLGEMVTDARKYRSETVTAWAEGSTQLISADCWNAVAPWDESYFLYSEETDFALRARDAGLATRFTPAARAVHLEGDSKVSPGLWALLTINKVRLYGRRHNRVATSAFWAALLLREASRAVLGRKPSRRAVRFLLNPEFLREVPGPHTVHGR